MKALTERNSEAEAMDDDQAARRLRRRLLAVIAVACVALLALYVASTISFEHSILQPIPGAYVAPGGHGSGDASHDAAAGDVKG